jgi:hypothetical protein
MCSSQTWRCSCKHFVANLGTAGIFREVERDKETDSEKERVRERKRCRERERKRERE